MEPTAENIAVIILGVLAYALVTCILSALSSRIRHARVRHDLIVASRKRRAEYLRSLAESGR